MERVRDLIHKLSVQEGAGESPAALLATVRALAAELEALQPRPAVPQGGRVAVLMPQGMTYTAPAATAAASPVEPVQTPLPEPVPEPLPEVPQEPQPEPVPEPPAEPEIVPVQEPAPEPEVTAATEPWKPEPYSIRPPVPTVPPAPQPFDPVAEVPTLAQQAPPAKEVFELHTPGESLNDRLRREEKELAHKLVDTPIKDLRKGIGINDRYLFLSELFRGDETMYERSIKTINAFHILPEAEYWINRELKVKLAWDDTHPTVQHFYQLVRRRFS